MATRANRQFPIALLTDFGYRDHYVGVMKGVIASIAPDAPLIDITHGIPPQSIAAGAIALRESWRFFPPRTIFLAIVDPGVGTERLPIAIETDAGIRMVGPDNGLMWPAARDAGFRRAVELRSPRYRLEHTSMTFHGRDIFAPAAAHLWNGARITSLGPEVSSIVEFDPSAGLREDDSALTGEIIYVDGFGNLISNIDRASFARFEARFRGRNLSVRIGRNDTPIRMYKAYGDAPTGASLATFGSFEMLEVAVRDSSAAHRFDAAQGTTVTVRAD